MFYETLSPLNHWEMTTPVISNVFSSTYHISDTLTPKSTCIYKTWTQKPLLVLLIACKIQSKCLNIPKTFSPLNCDIFGNLCPKRNNLQNGLKNYVCKREDLKLINPCHSLTAKCVCQDFLLQAARINLVRAFTRK